MREVVKREVDDTANGRPAESVSPEPHYHSPLEGENGEDEDDAREGYASSRDESGVLGSHRADSDAGRDYEPEDQVYSEEEDDSGDEDETLLMRAARLAQMQRTDTVAGLFRPENVFPEKKMGSKTILELHTMIKAGLINLSPSYQRESVWLEKNAEKLINSILCNMHVPTLLFNIHEPDPSDKEWYRKCGKSDQVDPDMFNAIPKNLSSKGKERAEGEGEPRITREVWRCMDGKQRMTSICKYIDGKIALIADDRQKYPYTSLPAEARKKFDSTPMFSCYYRDLSNKQEREMFKRVQLGKALTPGEVLASVPSEYADWISEIKHEFVALGDGVVGFEGRLFNSARGVDMTAAFQMTLNLLKTVHNNFDDINTMSADARQDYLKNTPLPHEDDRKTVHDALVHFQRLTLIHGSDRWSETSSAGRKKAQRGISCPHRVWRLRSADVNQNKEGRDTIVALAPVEPHFLTSVVYRFKHLRDGRLLELIENLRVYLHRTYRKEMKDNKGVYDAMKEWCDNFNEDDLEGIYKSTGEAKRHRRVPLSDLPAPSSSSRAKKTTASTSSGTPAAKKASGLKASTASTPQPRAPKASISGSNSASTSKAAAPAASGPVAPATYKNPDKPIKNKGLPSTFATPSSSSMPAGFGQRATPAPPPPAPVAFTSLGLSAKQQNVFASANPLYAQQRANINSLPSSKKRPASASVQYDDRGKPIYASTALPTVMDFEQQALESMFYEEDEAMFGGGGGRGGGMGGMNGGGGYETQEAYEARLRQEQRAREKDEQTQAILRGGGGSGYASGAIARPPSQGYGAPPSGNGSGRRDSLGDQQAAKRMRIDDYGRDRDRDRYGGGGGGGRGRFEEDEPFGRESSARPYSSGGVHPPDRPQVEVCLLALSVAPPQALPATAAEGTRAIRTVAAATLRTILATTGTAGTTVIVATTTGEAATATTATGMIVTLATRSRRDGGSYGSDPYRHASPGPPPPRPLSSATNAANAYAQRVPAQQQPLPPPPPEASTDPRRRMQQDDTSGPSKASMTSLIQGILEIVEGIFHTQFAIARTAVHLVWTFVEESVALANETVGFFFRNAVILGLVGSLFIAYTLYQFNTVRVKSRVEGGKKRL
ncbi:hypothetical protein JCM8547_002853 [Rhodosporidiobolus lusitaniae]